MDPSVTLSGIVPISVLYREFAHALTEVLAEKCRRPGSARPPPSRSTPVIAMRAIFMRVLTTSFASLPNSRAAMSLARVWRDQGKPQQARELLGLRLVH
jgi:hypothetical protein